MIKDKIYSSSILFSVLLLIFVNSSYGQEFKIHQFPENQNYGFVKPTEQNSDSGSTYYLIKYDNTLSGDNNYIILDSILSQSEPQMCDTNAVSYKSYHSDDSGILMAAILSPKIILDTLLIYPKEGFKLIINRDHPLNHVYNMPYHLFYRPDSILLWEHAGGLHHNLWEIGQIKPDNDYETLERQGGSQLPKMSSDFSQVVFADIPYCGGPCKDPNKSYIYTYDIKDKKKEAYRSILTRCRSIEKRTKLGPLYIVSDSGKPTRNYRNNLCIVEDSIPKILISVDWPKRIGRFWLYQDSIVYETSDCSIPFYGIKKHVIYE